MRRFYVRHFLFVAAVVAGALALTRLLGFEPTGVTALVIFSLFAPFFCFGLATLLTANTRVTRQVVRYSLLAASFGIFAVTYPPTHRFAFLALLCLVWWPQLIFLEAISACLFTVAASKKTVNQPIQQSGEVGVGLEAEDQPSPPADK